MASVSTLTTVFSSHEIWLERVAAQQSNALDPYIERVNKRMASLFNSMPKRSLSAMEQTEYRNKANAIYKEELTGWASYLKVEQNELGGYEAEFAANALDEVVFTEDFEAKVPTAAVVTALVNKTPIKIGEGQYTTYNKMLKDFSTTTTSKIDGVVRNGFAYGQTNQEIAQLILADSELVNAQAKTSAKAIARTGTTHYSTQARIALGRDNDDMIIGYRSIGTLDGNTSKQCAHWDQKVRKETDSDWSAFTPPRHRNCRTTLSLEIDGRYLHDDDTSTRPENFRKDGKADPNPVSSKRTYYDELNKLNASDQDAALGSPTLGRAFRAIGTDKAGRDAFGRQVLDSTYNPLSITDMKKKDNELARVLRKQSK